LNLFKKFSAFFASIKSQEPKTTKTFPLQFLFLLERNVLFVERLNPFFYPLKIIQAEVLNGHCCPGSTAYWKIF
jgi:hypothetical protein